jgi:hypothetical protein
MIKSFSVQTWAGIYTMSLEIFPKGLAGSNGRYASVFVRMIDPEPNGRRPRFSCTVRVHTASKQMSSKVLDDPFGWPQFTSTLTGSTRVQILNMARENQPQPWDNEQYLGCQVFDCHLRHRSTGRLLIQAPSISTPDAVLAMLSKAQRAPASCSLVQSTVARLLNRLTPISVHQLTPTNGASPALGPAAAPSPAAPAGGKRRGTVTQTARAPKRPRSPDHRPHALTLPPPLPSSAGAGVLVGAGAGGRDPRPAAPTASSAGPGAAAAAAGWDDGEVEITGVTRVDDPVATVDLLDD